MEYFKLGNKRDYYSKAFKLYRKEVIADYFGLIVGCIVLLSVALYIRSKIKSRREVDL
jgi:hypothetical protein